MVWIGLDPLAKTATMNCLEFDAAFLALYGSNYLPKFASYQAQVTGTGSSLFLLMDNVSGGLPLLVKVTYSTTIDLGGPSNQLLHTL